MPNCQDITYLFCFTGAETEIHNIKDDSKIIRQTNLDRHGLRPIPIICHLLDPPTFSLPSTFKHFFSVDIELHHITNGSNIGSLKAAVFEDFLSTLPIWKMQQVSLEIISRVYTFYLKWMQSRPFSTNFLKKPET